MIGLQTTDAAGLTWSSQGLCRGVRLRREGGRLRVTAVARQEPVDGAGAAGALIQVKRELGIDEATVVVAGPGDLVSAFVDLTMPGGLNGDELRSALRFELGRRSPVPVDKLIWGYRAVGRTATNEQIVRLIYLREADWNRCIGDLGALGHGVDAVLPPVAALDPVAADQAVFFPAAGLAGVLVRPVEQRGREALPVDSPPAEVLGGEDPLAHLPEIDAGPLADLSEDEQRRFLEPLLLGLYGMANGPAADRRSGLPVPFELRPKRHRRSKMLTVSLAAYLAILGLWSLFGEYQAAAAYRERLETRLSTAQAGLAEIQARRDPAETYDKIREELAAIEQRDVSLGQVLVELSQIVAKDVWVRSLSWKDDGRIEVQFQTDTEDADVITPLEQSALFTDVIRRQIYIRNGVTTIRVSMYTADGGTRKRTSPGGADDDEDAGAAMNAGGRGEPRLPPDDESSGADAPDPPPGGGGPPAAEPPGPINGPPGGPPISSPIPSPPTGRPASTNKPGPPVGGKPGRPPGLGDASPTPPAPPAPPSIPMPTPPGDEPDEEDD